jgi:hypothetical protein
MLLTFSEVGTISRSRHDFLEDAFSALWSRHDATKDAFYRPRRVDVTKSEFLSLVSAIAILSYAEEHFVMDESTIKRHVNTAVSICGLPSSINVDDFCTI